MPKIEYHNADCLEFLPTLPENSVDTVITDPPYHLTSGNRKGGFMGQTWDGGDIAFRPETWRAVLRVAKPGAFMLCFGGTRTWHRLACAIEDAGWELRDTMIWLYGSGFPKSLSISKAIDKAAGAEREVIGKRTDGRYARGFSEEAKRAIGSAWKENQGFTGEMGIITAPATEAAKLWSGWQTSLKPSFEPILVCMKPLDGTFADNALKHGVAGLNIDGARISLPQHDRLLKGGTYGGNRVSGAGTSCFGNGGKAVEYGPLPTGGRFPANLLLDESAAALLDKSVGTLKSGITKDGQMRKRSKGKGGYHGGFPDQATANASYGDSGGASRFFYVAKASRKDRGEGNTHPTTKPSDLMEYLCKLTSTPTKGVVLDPFMGSGTTALACIRTGRDFIGIEKHAPYFEIAKKRIEAEQREAASELF